MNKIEQQNILEQINALEEKTHILRATGPLGLNNHPKKGLTMEELAKAVDAREKIAELMQKLFKNGKNKDSLNDITTHY